MENYSNKHDFFYLVAKVSDEEREELYARIKRSLRRLIYVDREEFTQMRRVSAHESLLRLSEELLVSKRQVANFLASCFKTLNFETLNRPKIPVLFSGKEPPVGVQGVIMTKNSKSGVKAQKTAKLRRIAQLETLEARQLLSANPLTATAYNFESTTAVYAVALPEADYTVDTELDVVDATDGVTSLREALELAQAGEIIGFADDLDSVQLSHSISGKDGVMIQSSYAGISISEGVNITISDLDFNGVYIANDELDSTIVISNCNFTGSVAANGVLINNGEMTLQNVTIRGTTVTDGYTKLQERAYYRGVEVELPETLELALVYNNGVLTATELHLTENTGVASTDRLDCNMSFAGILNDYAGEMTLTSVSIGENTAVGETNRGDVSATFYGIENFGTADNLNNLMIFANKTNISHDSRFDVEESQDVYSVYTAIADVNIYNGTILQGMGSYRADFYIANTIYLANENVRERGFIIANSYLDGTGKKVVSPNLAVTDLSEIAANYAGFNAETGTFNKDEDGNYIFRLYTTAPVVNKGDNSFVNGYDIDLLGKARIVKEIVDLGAVESTVDKLVVRNLVGQPAAGTDGLNEVYFTWSPTEYAKSYKIRYRVGDGKWIDDLVDAEEIIDPETDLPTYTIDGISPGTVVQIEVTAISGSIDWEDSDMVSAKTKTKVRIADPDPQASLGDTRLIDIQWYLVTNAQNYTLQYRKYNESQGAEENWVTVENVKTWTTLGVGTVGKDGTDTGYPVDYDTTYEFRLKANHDGDIYADSNWSYTTKTSGVLLEAPTLNVTDSTIDSVTLTITDTVNIPEAVKKYTVEYRIKGTTGTWKQATVDGKTAVASDLDQGKTYEFRAKAIGNTYVTDPLRWGDDSGYSKTVTATTSERLNKPVVSAEGKSDTEIKASWKTVEHADYYIVYILDPSGEQIGDKVTTILTNNTFTGLEQNTTYTVVVEAYSNNAEYLPSEGRATATTWKKLTPPTITMDSRTTKSITVKWNAVSDASSYIVESSLDGETWTVLYTGTNTSATWTEPDGKDVDPKTDVWFRIQSVGSTSAKTITSDFSDPYLCSTKERLVIDPTAFEAEGTSDTTIKADWEAVEGSTGYMLRYKPAASSSWITVDTKLSAQTLTYILRSLTSDTVYDVAIKAVGDGDESVDSEWVSTTATTWHKLAAPVIDNASVVITENSISGKLIPMDLQGKTYKLWYTTEKGTTWTEVSLDKDLNFMVDGLEPLTTYRFRTQAIGSDADKTVSSEYNFNSSTGQTAEWKTIKDLDTPDVDKKDVTSDSITVFWDPIPHANKYKVIWCIDGTAEEQSKIVTDTTTILSDLTSNTKYVIKVIAISDDPNYGNSDPGQIEVTTEQATVDTPVVEAKYNADDDEINVSWDLIEGAVSYTIRWKLEGSETWIDSKVLGAGTHAYTLENPQADSVYVFEVIAKGADGKESEPGTAVAPTPATIELQAVVLKKASEEGLTIMPKTEKWVDEWTNIFIEVWTEDTDKLVQDRTFTFTLEFSDKYIVDVQEVEGFTIVDNGDGSYTVTVDETQEGDVDTLMARIQLTVNDKNIVNWQDHTVKGGYKINGDAVSTEIYAVPGDLNDDGSIDIDRMGEDTAIFDAELAKAYSYADFNFDGIVNKEDRQWMIENNRSKNWQGVAVIYPDGFEYHLAPVVLEVTAVSKAIEEEPLLATSVEFVDGNPYYEITQGTAGTYASETPVENDANTTTDNAKKDDQKSSTNGLIQKASYSVKTKTSVLESSSVISAEAADAVFGSTEEQKSCCYYN